MLNFEKTSRKDFMNQPWMTVFEGEGDGDGGTGGDGGDGDAVRRDAQILLR